MSEPICTPYIDCGNTSEGWESIFKRLIVEMPDGSLALRTACCESTPPVELPLILTFDDIANAACLIGTTEDAPAPGNITITPDAVGDNPVTWYYTVCYDNGADERSLFSVESSFTIGDATTELIFNCDAIPDWGVELNICLGIVSETYTHSAGIFSLPSEIIGFSEGTCELINGLPIHQDCVPGDVSDVSDWNTFFGLPGNGSAFTSVVVNGNEVNLYGGAGITLTNGETGYACGDIGGELQLFEANAHLIGVDDQAGCVVAIADACFYGGLAGEGCGFVSPLVGVIFPACLTIGEYAFSACVDLAVVDFAVLTTIGDLCFSSDTSLISISIPLCTTLGATVGDDFIFNGIIGNTISVTCPASLLTCDGGQPDGDLCALIANNTVTINGTPAAPCAL